MMEPAAPGVARPEASRRGWHWGWSLVLTAVLLTGAAAVVLHSPWFKLRTIEIVGAERADVAGRLTAAGIGPGRFMIWLQPGEAEAAVRADPWVAAVRVKREFPDRLVVTVAEHVPAVWIGHGASWRLVAQSGAVVAASGDPGEGLLRARVPWDLWEPGEQPAGAEWQEMAALGLALSPELAARAWVTSEGGELWLEAGGRRARLGAPVDLADKGRVFEAMLGTELPAGATLDLVAPTRPAVVLPGGAALPEGEPLVEGENEG